jgi:hypothetical protein
MLFLLAGKVLLTLSVLGYSLATILVDLNKTHATNPDWVPHARFHLVWQVTCFNVLGALSLLGLWLPGPYAAERVYGVIFVAAAVYGSFFIALFAKSSYGGDLYDRNGYPPFQWRQKSGAVAELDRNTTVVIGQLLLLILATLLVIFS